MNLFEIGPDTLVKWKKSGCPHKKGERRRDGDKFSLEAVRDWLNETKKYHYARKISTSISNEARAAGADADPVVIPTAAELKNTDEIEEINERLRIAEKITHSQWARGVKQKLPSTELQLLEKIWLDVVEKRCRVEKAIPEILAQKGRYRDYNIVKTQVDRICTIFKDGVLRIPANIRNKIFEYVHDQDDRITVEELILDELRHYLENCIEELKNI